jgi:hypothetical protein
MGKVSAVGPGTEAGKLILSDFKNWRTTGFKPWVQKGLGGVSHYKSRAIYRKSVSANAFRSQAKKLAAIALEQMPAVDIEDKDEDEDENDDEDLPSDSQNKNPWERTEYGSDNNGENNGDNDGDDEDFLGDEGSEKDHELDEDFEDVMMVELMDSRAPLVTEYPNGKKVGIVFVCDGDVKDVTSNYFEFGSKNDKLMRWSRIPIERTKASHLIGTSSDEPEWEDFGFSDADLMVLDGVIQSRLKGVKEDEQGDRWEIRDTVDLPFACDTVLYNKQGKTIKNYMLRRNKKGFTWGYFWLMAKKEKKKQPKRMGGSKVTTVDDSSVYTDKTFHSA